MTHNNYTRQTAPESFITKGKQRIRQFDNTVYLKNGDEFEIELFNPTQNKLLAKIQMNGKPISGGGIVLRPGERVYLERYLDDAKKFLFDTYSVDGDYESSEAIKKNGEVTISFYEETTPTIHLSNTTYINNWDYNQSTPFSGYHTTGDVYGANVNSTFTTTGMATLDSLDASDSVVSSSLRSSSTHRNQMGKLKKSKLIETGRVEKGGKSSQKFKENNDTFNPYTLKVIEWKIKPLSTKPITVDEIKTYCGECGSKKKKQTHKFCPHCGEKF